MSVLALLLLLQDATYVDEARGFSLPLAGWKVDAKDTDLGAVRLVRGEAVAVVRAQPPMRVLRGAAVDVREMAGTIRDQNRKKFKDYEQTRVEPAEGRLAIDATYSIGETPWRSFQLLVSTPRGLFVATWMAPAASWEERRAEIEAMAAGFAVKP